jgi:Predicted inhibitor of MCP methylation, homolog of CheC
MQQNMYVDTIFEGSNYVIRQITGSEVIKGAIHMEKPVYSSNDVSIIIGVNGSLNGHVMFSMSELLAFKITSMIIGQDVVNSLDEMTKSCLSEMGNMIMGYTSGIFFEKGIAADITPPAIITGKDVCISTDKSEIAFCLPVVFEDGHVLTINTAFTKNAA